MSLRVLAVLVMVPSCVDAIEVELQLPQSPDATFDLRCINSVELVAVNERFTAMHDDPSKPDRTRDCVNIDGATSFQDVLRQVQGHLELTLPEGGLDGVLVRGFSGSCDTDGQFRPAIFYGGSRYAGTGQMTVPMERNVTCAASPDMVIRPLDLTSLMAGACVTPMDSDPIAFGIDARPLALGRQPRMTFEAASSPQPVRADTVTVAMQTNTNASTCMGGGYVGGGAANDHYAAQCGNRGRPTACGPGVELAAMTGLAYDQAKVPALVRDYGNPVIGIVMTKENGKPKPLPDARITIDHGKGKVDYLAPNSGSFQSSNGAMTGPSGMFAVYIPGDPTVITVSAGGYKQEQYNIASSPDLPATLIVVLDPAAG